MQERSLWAIVIWRIVCGAFGRSDDDHVSVGFRNFRCGGGDAGFQHCASRSLRKRRPATADGCKRAIRCCRSGHACGQRRPPDDSVGARAESHRILPSTGCRQFGDDACAASSKRSERDRSQRGSSSRSRIYRQAYGGVRAFRQRADVGGKGAAALALCDLNFAKGYFGSDRPPFGGRFFDAFILLRGSASP